MIKARIYLKTVDQGSPLKNGISHPNFIEKCVQQGKARVGSKVVVSSINGSM
jgi:hypothetical protein